MKPFEPLTRRDGRVAFDIVEVLQRSSGGSDRHEVWPSRLNPPCCHHKRTLHQRASAKKKSRCVYQYLKLRIGNHTKNSPLPLSLSKWHYLIKEQQIGHFIPAAHFIKDILSSIWIDTTGPYFFKQSAKDPKKRDKKPCHFLLLCYATLLFPYVMDEQPGYKENASPPHNNHQKKDVRLYFSWAFPIFIPRHWATSTRDLQRVCYEIQRTRKSNTRLYQLVCSLNTTRWWNIMMSTSRERISLRIWYLYNRRIT